jgi:hypothetical protein
MLQVVDMPAVEADLRFELMSIRSNLGGARTTCLVNVVRHRR